MQAKNNEIRKLQDKIIMRGNVKTMHNAITSLYNDPKRTLEENKIIIKERQEQMQKNEAEIPKPAANVDKGVPHKGNYALIPPKSEQAGMFLVHDAQLYCEPCHAIGVCQNQGFRV
jgi:hypothetical protein